MDHMTVDIDESVWEYDTPPEVAYDRCLDDAVSLLSLASKHSDHWTPEDYHQYRSVRQRVEAADEMRQSEGS